MSPRTVRWVEQIAEKREDVGADKAVAVSSESFTQGAQNLADAKRVVLRTVSEIQTPDVLDWLGVDVINVESRQVKFGQAGVFLRNPDRPPSGGTLTVIKSGEARTGDRNFVRKIDGSKASIYDAWLVLSQDPAYDALYEDLAVDERRTIQAELIFENPDDCYQAHDGNRLLDVEKIEFRDTEIWIEQSEVPFSRLHEYMEGDRLLARRVEAVIEDAEGSWTVEIHAAPTEDDQQRMSIRVKRQEREGNT